MKKFYHLVSRHEGVDGFEVHLDGKPVKTPSGKSLSIPTAGLADEIVEEWAVQKDDILPDTMPLTQIAVTALDRVSAQRGEIMHEVMKYLDTDLLCYRAERPEDLAEKQHAAWQPWLDWFAGEFGETLETTTELDALTQSEAARSHVRNFIDGLDDMRFTVLQIVTAQSGSLVLAIAFAKAAINAEELFNAVFVEELYKADIYNEELHGPDPLQERRQESFRNDLRAAQKFLALL